MENQSPSQLFSILKEGFMFILVAVGSIWATMTGIQSSFVKKAFCEASQTRCVSKLATEFDKISTEFKAGTCKFEKHAVKMEGLAVTVAAQGENIKEIRSILERYRERRDPPDRE
mgnify:CR=1 FL=1